MKLAKLSLAAIAVVGLSTSSFAADTLADAFKNGKVSGALQAYYFTRDNGTKDADIATFGVDLSYQTDTFNGFAFKATFQSSAAPFADEDAKTGGANFSGDMWGSGAQLSEAYISYAMGKTTALVGRMYLDTPLIASSGSRMNKEAFEGAAVINTDLPDTTLILGYVQKFQSRTDSAGNIGEFNKIGTDGAYEVAVINNSIKGLTLTAAYADVIDAVTVGYAEAAYKAGAFGVAGQYYYSEVEGADDTNLLGVKADATFGAASIYVAYTTVDDAAEVVPGLGNGADLAYTGSWIDSWVYVADMDAYAIGASYAVLPNANIAVAYVVEDDNAADMKYSYADIGADYTFDGALKGLSIALQYEDKGKDIDGNELRFKANYAF